jgi:hypothetical protein
MDLAAIASRLLDFLDSPRARRYWSGWTGVRCVIAYTVWWFRSAAIRRTTLMTRMERAPVREPARIA